MVTPDCAAWALLVANGTGTESSRALAGTARVVTRARLRIRADTRMASLLKGEPLRAERFRSPGVPAPSVIISWQSNELCLFVDDLRAIGADGAGCARRRSLPNHH